MMKSTTLYMGNSISNIAFSHIQDRFSIRWKRPGQSIAARRSLADCQHSETWKLA